ncbi:MAG: replicative DNA helicase [Bacilli bacterium]|nr:replicative DNA helicase [Bacilli bacterium]
MKEVNIPNNIEAEESVIGSMLLTKKALQKSLENLSSEDFYLDAHAKIFECIKNINDRQKPVDLTTLAEELNNKGWLKQIGGVEYIADAINSVPTTANIDEYINIVLEKSLLRRLIDEATEIVKGSYSVGNDVGDYLYEAQKKITKVSEGLRASEFKSIQTVLTKAQSDLETLAANKGDITGIPTGFYDLDKITSGFHPNELIIIAARPGMGKTAIALNMATNIAMNAKKSVAIFNMEMGAEQLVTRMLSQVGGIDGSKLRVGNLEHSDWKRVNEAISRLSDTKIFIDDTAGQTVADIRSKCRRLKNSPSGLDIVIIDYLTLIQSANKNGSTGQNRQQEVADISRALKTMAMELEIPVIALSQLSRGIEQRTDKKPMLSDLRESGAIEQDADLVAFLHCNDEEKEKDDSLMEFVIRKHRNGPLKDVPLLFRRNTSTFVNVANPNIEEEN